MFTTIKRTSAQIVVRVYYTEEFELFLSLEDVFKYVENILDKQLWKSDAEKAIRQLPTMWVFMDRNDPHMGGEPEVASDQVVRKTEAFGLQSILYTVLERRLKIFSDWTQVEVELPTNPTIFRVDGNVSHSWPEVTPLVMLSAAQRPNWTLTVNGTWLSGALREGKFAEAADWLTTHVSDSCWAAQSQQWRQYIITDGLIDSRTRGVTRTPERCVMTNLCDLVFGVQSRWKIQEADRRSRLTYDWPEPVLILLDDYVFPEYFEKFGFQATDQLWEDLSFILQREIYRRKCIILQMMVKRWHQFMDGVVRPQMGGSL